MADENPSTEEASPRSTVLLCNRISTVLPSIMSEGGGSEKAASPEKEVIPDEPDSPKKENNTKDTAGRMTPTTPLPQEYYNFAAYPTSQPSPYYRGYGQTPEPASPAYTDFFPASPFLATPLSPSRTFMTSIPPGSPLIPPRVDNSFYNGVTASVSSEEAWAGLESRAPPNGYPSPQLPYGMPLGRGRAYSLEDTMLPPPAVEDPSFSPYSNHVYQNGWGYPNAAPPDIYSASASPLQPRAAMYSMPRGMYYPATSPGPPIQTTSHNKGPDGANLFIFHIPNHFTNQDMFRLFEPYGNLLSVRIMVEKDTGRSRGFGFVSYDTPESAAVAIQKLNGFQLGNKRLKVQHKQIRREEAAPADYGFNANLPNTTLPPTWEATQQSSDNQSPLANLSTLTDALPNEN